MTPLSARRWYNFRRNRRGYWSALIFGVLFCVSLGAEFIVNDKPLLLSFDDSFYYPIFASYPETAFGGEFETEADYRDEFVVDLIEAERAEPEGNTTR